MARALLLIIGLPLVEVAGFAVVGGRIGAAATVALTAATAVAGLCVVRWQGLGLARRFAAAFARDEAPVAEAVEGLALAVAGVLLLLPGFAGDLVGAALLVPPVRRAAAAWAVGRRAGRGPVVVDGEFRRIAPDSPPRRPRGER